MKSELPHGSSAIRPEASDPYFANEEHEPQKEEVTGPRALR